MIPSPGELLRRHGLSARKSWGQNFLHAVHVHEAIVRAAGAANGRRVVEIGAGLGTLTAHLLAAGAEVWAIERDRDLCAVLRTELANAPGFRLIEADAVRFDYATAVDPVLGKPTIVGNLPYHLTAPLLFALLDHHAHTADWIVMVQREVADRLCAPPGNRVYGSTSVVLGRVRSLELVTSVVRGAFVPAPRVDSAVIRLRPRAQVRGDVGDERAFRGLVRAAFQQRRKTLANALRSLGDRERVHAWCAAASVDPQTRPETLSPEQFAALQRARESDPAPTTETPAGNGDA